jgi:spermidine synthase
MNSKRNIVLFILFFLSGFCSLLYQVVWLRLAFASFGIITPVMSVLISVFMSGLALGSWAGGKWIGKLSKITRIPAINFYALAEFLIGIGAFLVPAFFSYCEGVLLAAGEMDSFQYLLISAFLMTLSILPWCILMGFTFPFMMSFIREIDRSNTESFSFLYISNVVGAMTGTILTAFVLIELFGFRSTSVIAALLNFLIAMISIILGKRYSCSKSLPEESRQENCQLSDTALPGSGAVVIVMALFTTGLTSMSMEVVWIRAFMPILGTQIYSFAAILSVYLFATWTGSNGASLSCFSMISVPVRSLSHFMSW